MSGWSRRSVLAALGMAPLVPACGGVLGGGRSAPAVPLTLAATRVRLRELVASIQSRFPYAAATATVQRRARAVADGSEGSLARSERIAVVFTAADADGTVHERATNDLSSDGLVRAAAALLGDGKANPDFGEPHSFPILGPAIERTGAGWVDRAQGLYERARRHGGSRVVYRGAYVDVEDTESVFIGDGRDLGQRVVRLRTGAFFVAAAGSLNYVDSAERAGTITARRARVTDDELAAAADGALALLTARPAPPGEYDVLLDPGCAGMFAGRCVAPALAVDRWNSHTSAAGSLQGQPIGSPQVTLIDDPTLPGAYGSYSFDDEGVPAAVVHLIEEGVLRSALTDRAGAARARLTPTASGRRDELTGPVRPRPSNIYFSGGAAAGRDELLDGVEAGLLLEGALSASGDASSWTALVRIARAREIAKGKLTGRLYGPVLLHGRVPDMLAAVAGATTHVRHRVAGPGASMGGPFLLTRAAVVGG